MIPGDDRPLAPLGARAVPVTGAAQLGAYTMIEADDASGVRPRAGQFYMLSAVSEWGGGADGRPYLPRALSFARVLEMNGALRLTFLLEAVGPGTGALARLEIGDQLLITGPFGNGFAVADDEPVLVGGGIGVAPVLALFDELLAQGNDSLSVLLGFRTAGHARAAELFDGAAVVATDDGSLGHHGFVTELLEPRIANSGHSVYACGPPPMLESVRQVCRAAETPSQLALESGMACGYGACYGCVVPTYSGLLRLCVDGPVLEGDDLESALVGTH